MKSRHSLQAATLLYLAGCLSVFAAAEPAAGLSRADVSFLKRAAKIGLAEVAISEGALPRLTDPEAKSFAETMVAEHTPANAELLALAAKKQVNLAAEDKEVLALADEWSLKTKDVDLDYVDKMVADHADTIRLFERATKSRDREIAAFAAKTLPTLEHHLDMIQAIKRTFRKE